jgi:hypothetical protein
MMTTEMGELVSAGISARKGWASMGLERGFSSRTIGFTAFLNDLQHVAHTLEENVVLEALQTVDRLMDPCSLFTLFTLHSLFLFLRR